MHCASYCVGASYDLTAVANYFNGLGNPPKIYSKEVVYVPFPVSYSEKEVDVFIFSYGCIIFWGTDTSTEETIIEHLTPYLEKPFNTPVVDRCKYKMDEEEDTFIDEENDEISIKDYDPYVKLSFSYGLSQSVKLNVLESSVNKSIEENKNIPMELINTGKISLSRRALSKKIGLLFTERNMVSLNNEILDTPNFFWKRPKYEQYYEMSLKFLDIRPRIDTLNKRLDVIHELYEILSTELQHIHSSRLEMIIIFLIMLEVALVIFKEIL